MTVADEVLCQYLLNVSFSVCCKAVIEIFNCRKVHNTIFTQHKSMFEKVLERIISSPRLLQTSASLPPSFPHFLILSEPCFLALSLSLFLSEPPSPVPSLKNVEGPVIRMHAWFADDRVYIAAVPSVFCSATSVCSPYSRVCPQPKTGSNVCYLKVKSWTNICSCTDYTCFKTTSTLKWVYVKIYLTCEVICIYTSILVFFFFFYTKIFIHKLYRKSVNTSIF